MTVAYLIEISGRRVPVRFATAVRAAAFEDALRRQGAVAVVAVFEEADRA